MKKLTLTFLIILFTLASNVVLSRDDTNLSGYHLCGNFLNYCENKKNINCEIGTSWTMGYISGKTYMDDIWISKNTFDFENIKYALIKYCRDNPLKDTHDASEDIFNQLQ
jgi:hypothetical protein